MNLLFINTALNSKCVALIQNKNSKNETVFVEQISGFKKDLEQGLAGVLRVLKKADLELEQIDCVCVIAGPGNFSAIRVGFIVAETISSQIANCDFWAIDSLSVLEFINGFSGKSSMNASKTEIYKLKKQNILGAKNIELCQFNSDLIDAKTIYSFDEKFIETHNLRNVNILNLNDLISTFENEKFIDFLSLNKLINITEPIYIKEPNIHVKN